MLVHITMNPLFVLEYFQSKANLDYIKNELSLVGSQINYDKLYFIVDKNVFDIL